MSYKELKERVYNCNLELYRRSLVVQTFGNVSAFDRNENILAIKPSGVPYYKLKVDDIIIVDLNNQVIDSTLKPSSDTKTHILLYNAFPSIGGIVHTHSTFATAWSQTKKSIPCFGTTHADYVQGEIPCTEDLSKKQIEGDYEIETGNQIIKRLKDFPDNSIEMILVSSHGPFVWGKSPEDALHNSILLEEIAKVALLTLSMNPDLQPIGNNLLNKHFRRKNGPKAYYGQKIEFQSGV